MSAYDVMKAALEELASQGNEQAKIALAIATKQPILDLTSLKSQLSAELRSCGSYLGDAITANATSWTKLTDQRINDAHASLMRAMSILMKA